MIGILPELAIMDLLSLSVLLAETESEGIATYPVVMFLSGFKVGQLMLTTNWLPKL